MYLNSSLKSYEKKYRKYKSKYKILKSHIGGACDPLPNPEEEDIVSRENLLDLCPEERITIQNKCYEVNGLYRWIITDNKSILPGIQTKITEEEKRRLDDNNNNIFRYAKKIIIIIGRAQKTKIIKQNFYEIFYGLKKLKSKRWPKNRNQKICLKK